MKILTLVVTAAVLVAGAAAQDVYTLSDGTPCPLAGSAKGDAVKALNRDKNRFTSPQAGDVDTSVTLAAMLSPGDDEGRFDGTRAARVVGFVIDVHLGGKETCNCEATDPVDRDAHVELALATDAPPNQRVIVEVTPRFRLKELNQGVDWSTMTLSSQGPEGIKGKWVEITGWLLFDFEHVDAAENTNPGNPGNWRATCWEIHPITSITVLDEPPPSVPLISSGLMRELQGVHARHMKRDPARRKAVAARIEAVRAKIGQDDDEEIREGR